MNELKLAVKTLMDRERWHESRDLLLAHRSDLDSDPRLLWDLGWSLFKLKQYGEATRYLEQASLALPDDPIVAWALGVAQREAEAYPAAERSFLRALSLQDSYLGRLNLATMYVQLGRIDEALEVYREGVRLQPDHRERLEVLADLLLELGRVEEATGLRQRAECLPTREQRKKRQGKYQA